MSSIEETIREGVASLTAGVRIGKFLSVGAMGAVLDTIVTLLLKDVLTVHPDVAKFVGAECAILAMFVANEHWTFAGEGEDGTVAFLRRLVTSNLVRSGGLAVQLVVFSYVRRLPITIPVAGFDLWTVLPIFIAIGAAVAVNYVAESLFTWRVHD